MEMKKSKIIDANVDEKPEEVNVNGCNLGETEVEGNNFIITVKIARNILL